MTDAPIRTRVKRDDTVRVRVQQPDKIRVRMLPSLLPKEPTMAVGTVTTLAPGADATFVNVGTPQDAIFDIGIPAGEPGADGEAGGRTVLVADTTYHAIDYPSPAATGGGTGTGTSLDPFVGPQYALDWIKRNIDSAGFDVRLEIAVDMATENGFGGFFGLLIDCTPVVGGGHLTVAFMSGAKITCATSGTGIVNDSYDFVTIETPDFDGADDSVFFNHIASNGVTFASSPKYGKSGFGSHKVILSNSEIREDGEVVEYGGGFADVDALEGSKFVSTANYTVTGAPDFTAGGILDDAAFAVGQDSALIDYGSGTITGAATGPLYNGKTGTSIKSVNTLPGDAPGTLDATSSYNGVFGAGGGSGGPDITEALTETVTAAGSYLVSDTVRCLLFALAAPGTVDLDLGSVSDRADAPLHFSDLAGNVTLTGTPDGSEKLQGISGSAIPIGISSGQGIGLGLAGTLYPNIANGGWFS